MAAGNARFERYNLRQRIRDTADGNPESVLNQTLKHSKQIVYPSKKKGKAASVLHVTPAEGKLKGVKDDSSVTVGGQQVLKGASNTTKSAKSLKRRDTSKVKTGIKHSAPASEIQASVLKQVNKASTKGPWQYGKFAKDETASGGTKTTRRDSGRFENILETKSIKNEKRHVTLLSRKVTQDKDFAPTNKPQNKQRKDTQVKPTPKKKHSDLSEDTPNPSPVPEYGDVTPPRVRPVLIPSAPRKPSLSRQRFKISTARLPFLPQNPNLAINRCSLSPLDLSDVDIDLDNCKSGIHKNVGSNDTKLDDVETQTDTSSLKSPLSSPVFLTPASTIRKVHLYQKEEKQLNLLQDSSIKSEYKYQIRKNPCMGIGYKHTRDSRIKQPKGIPQKKVSTDSDCLREDEPNFLEIFGIEKSPKRKPSKETVSFSS